MLKGKLIFAHTPSVEEFLADDGESFRKDILAVGKYTHPKEGWSLDVDEDYLMQLAKNFNEFKEQGIDVEVTVDHSQSARDVIGRVVKVDVKDGRLYAIHRIIGDENLDLIKRNRNVSPEIDKQYVGSDGRHYGPALTASSIVKGPIVPGQDDFVRIAASRGGNSGDQNVPVLRWSTAKGDNQMSWLDDLKKHLGKSELTEEQIVDAVKAHEDGMRSEADASKVKLEGLLDEIKVDRDILSTKVKELTAKVDDTDKLDPDRVDDLTEDVEERIDDLVTAGKLEEKIALSLRGLLVGTSEARPTLMFSRVDMDNGKRRVRAHAILDIIDSVKNISTEELTGPQVVALSRKGSNNSDEDDVGNLTKQMIKDAEDASAGDFVL